jgi:hypothetical protein
MHEASRHAIAYLNPGMDGGFRILVLEIVDCATSEDLAEALREFSASHPDASLRTWSPGASPAELGVAVASAMAPRSPTTTTPVPQPKTKEPVLPYLRQIAGEDGERWWTTRELVERCVELGWSSSSNRATGSIVRRLPTLAREEGYEVRQRGRGRATRWQLGRES